MPDSASFAVRTRSRHEARRVFRLVMVVAWVLAGSAAGLEAVPPRQAAVAPSKPEPERKPSNTLVRVDILQTTKVDFGQIHAWAEAVWRHEPGQADDAALDISTWSAETLAITLTDVSELAQAFAYLRTRDTACAAAAGRPCASRVMNYRLRQVVASRNPAGPQRGDTALDELLGLMAEDVRAGHTNRLLERGAMLHTDIALLVPTTLSSINKLSILPPGVFITRQVAVEAVDGQVRGTPRDVSGHWTSARFLLDAVESSPDRYATVDWKDVRPVTSDEPMVRFWYRATSALLASQGRWQDVIPNLLRAQQIFPDDAYFVFQSGVVHEDFASPTVQSATRDQVRAGIPMNVVNAPRELQQAEVLLRQAVTKDPDFAEARLRLGRVLGRMNRHEEAAQELAKAETALVDPVLQYYTALFLGREQEILGNADAARASYARAQVLVPGSQSALLAMSALARRQGDSAGALATLEPLLRSQADGNTRADPWPTYSRSHVRDADALMAELRASVARDPGR